MEFEVIHAQDRIAWNKVLKSVCTFDFYHTSSYHLADRSGDPRMLVFREKQDCFAIPLIFRDIPDSEWKDVTSVYGYAGWICTDADIPAEVFEIMEDYFHRQKVISAFSRLHPLIKGSDHYQRGRVEALSSTLAIDLKLPLDVQFNSFSKSVQRTIIKRRKEGVVIRPAGNRVEIEQFIRIYNDAMKRLNASSHYYFDQTYFDMLLDNSDFDSFVLVSELGNIIIGGALFVNCNDIMQYHLGAVVEEFQEYSPLKLLIDEARVLGTEKKLSILHLGGGHGNREDSLFVFKSRMGTLKFPFKVWKWIINESVYGELSAGRLSSSFFPLYRC